MRWVRIGLPVAIVLGGVAMMIIEPGIIGVEGAMLMFSAALSIWLLNWLFRYGARGDLARDDEEAARAYFDEHGRWPDDG
jgi:hypothetical protein